MPNSSDSVRYPAPRAALQQRFAVVLLLALLLSVAGIPFGSKGVVGLFKLPTASAAGGGPVILDGTDAGLHNLVNYEKAAYTNLLGAVPGTYSNNGHIAVIGTSASGCNATANNAYLGLAGGLASGIDYYTDTTTPSVTQFFSDVAAGTLRPKLIHIIEYNWCSGGMNTATQNVVNANGAVLATHVNRGGALFAQHHSYGWLSAMFPTITFSNGCTGGSTGSTPTLTSAGTASFPGLTNSNITSPWHGCFKSTDSTFPLPVLGEQLPWTSPNTRYVIIGGSAISLPSNVTLAATPASPTPGTNVCVDATILSGTGGSATPIVGASVTFTVAGQNTFVGTATTDSAGAAQYCYTGTGSGTDTVTVTYTSGAGAGENTATVVWSAPAGAAQTITFGTLADIALGDAAPTLAATASSSLAVTYAASPSGVCTQSAGVLTIVGVGTCTVTASQAGDSSFLAAPDVVRTFVVKSTQTITFPALSGIVLGQAAPTLSATASSSLPVTYAASPSGVCAQSVGVLTIVGPGTCTVTVTQAGNGTIAPAPAVVRTFVVLGTQGITFPVLADITFGDAAPALGATASSSLPVTYSAAPSSVCTVAGSTLTIVGPGSCTVTATQAGDAGHAPAASVIRSFIVRSTQTIDFPVLADIVMGDAAPVLAAVAPSGLAVVYGASPAGVCTQIAGVLTIVGPGVCTVTADQPGDATHAAAVQVSRVFVVKSTQGITFPAPPDATLGWVVAPLLATAGSGLPVSYVSATPDVCTVTGATVTLMGIGTCTVTAEQAGDAAVAASIPVTRSFLVTAVAAPIITPADQQPPANPVDQQVQSPDQGAQDQAAADQAAKDAADKAAKDAADRDAAAKQAAADAPASAPETLALADPDGGQETTEGTRPAAIDLGAVSPKASVVADKDAPSAKKGVADVKFDGSSIIVTPLIGFSGVVSVPVTVTDGDTSKRLSVQVTVNPVPVPKSTYTIAGPDKTKVQWAPSENATGYRITLNGKVVCSTTELGCVVDGLVGPASKVEITALGNDGTSSRSVSNTYDKDLAAPVARVQFATGDATLSSSAKRDLDRLVKVAVREGFTEVVVAGHTDSVGTDLLNQELSRQRAVQVRAYLEPKLKAAGLKLVVKAAAASEPVATNASASGRAANRRVDVTLR